MQGNIFIVKLNRAKIGYADVLIGQIAPDNVIGRASLSAEAENKHVALSEIFNQLLKHIYASPQPQV